MWSVHIHTASLKVIIPSLFISVRPIDVFPHFRVNHEIFDGGFL